jgi:hypothetical protein
MAQVGSRRRLTTDSRVRSQASQCEICGGQTGTRTGVSRSTSVFPCRQYRSTIAPSSPSSERCSYHAKQAKRGNISKSNALSEIGVIWV